MTHEFFTEDHCHCGLVSLFVRAYVYVRMCENVVRTDVPVSTGTVYVSTVDDL